MPKKAITQLFLEKISPPKAGAIMYWDTRQPGLALRVAASGAKSWKCMYRVNGRLVKETLGTLAKIPKVEEARRRATASLEKARAGINLVAERRAAASRAAANTVAAAAGRWLTQCERDLRPKTVRGYRQIFLHDVLPRWGDWPIDEIKKADVLDLLNDKAAKRDRNRGGLTQGAAVQANRVLTRLRTFFGWCVANDLAAADPSAGVMKPAKETPRDRVLSDDEILAFWAATEALDANRKDAVAVGALFRVMLLTGQRETETAGMRWVEIDDAKREWMIPGARTKNGKEHVVALSELAVDFLPAQRQRQEKARKEKRPELRKTDDVVFSTTGKRPATGFARAKTRLDNAMLKTLRESHDGDAGLPPFVLHDLRRTATSCMARLGIEPHVADRVLNHTAGTIRGVAATYNRFQYLDERRLALRALGRFIALLVHDRLPGHVAEARVKLWLREQREQAERSAAGNVVDLRQRAW